MTEERVPSDINTKPLDDLTIRTEQEKSQEPAHGDSFQPDEKESDSLEGGLYDSFVNITHDDVSSVEDPSAESSRTLLQHQQAMDEDTSRQVAIYCQDPPDIDFLWDMIGDIGLDVVKSNDLSSFRELLSIHRIGTCFIVLKAEDIKNELLQKPLASRYLDRLLREVKCTVERKAVFILHGSDMVSHCEEDEITAKIREVLNEKGVVLWQKPLLPAKRARFSRSKSCPNYEEGKTSTNKGYRLQAQPPSDTKDSTLVLQTRLHHGKISYEEKDVMHRLEGWTAPEKMGEELMTKWSSIANAQLEISRDTNTGNYYITVKEDNVTLMSRMWEFASDHRPQIMNQLTSLVGASPPEDVLNLD